MVGYVLRNTLTENGTVSRGRCAADEDGMLVSIKELTKIKTAGNDAEFLGDDGEWKALSGDTIVSMNCWGLTPAIFPELERGFINFLSGEGGKALKSEYYLPGSVDEIMKAGKCDVKVYPTSASWYGVTYSEDKPAVVASIKSLIDGGEYPATLWK
jgi:hypothetical protein